MRKYFIVNDERNYPELVGEFDAERLIIGDIELSRGSFYRRSFLRGFRQVVNCVRLFPYVFARNDGSVFICQSSHYAALIAGKIGRLFRQNVAVYLFNFFVHPATRKGRLRGVVRWLLDQRVGIYVNAPNEVSYYRSLNPSIDVQYYPFCLGKVEGLDSESIAQETFIFSGGHTNRDYTSLLIAAEKLPSIRFLVACSEATVLPSTIPSNVAIVRDTPPMEFHRLMKSAWAVVVPLASDIGSSGQMVALAAMQFGKVVVYADYPSLSQYFEDGVTGIRYSPADIDGLVDAIRKAQSSGGPSSKIGARAKQLVEERYSWDAYEHALITNVKTFIERQDQNTKRRA